MGEKTAGVGHFQLPTMPAAATAVAQSASANTFGSYVALTASSPAALYITGLFVNLLPTTNEPSYVSVQVGTGGAGSETTVGTYVLPVMYTNGTTGARVQTYIPIEPPIPVATATRIACKTASDIASALSWGVILTCINQSNVVDDGVAETSNVTQWNGTNVSAPATAGIPDVNVKNINNVAAATPGASGGILISGSNAGTTTLGALTVTGALTVSGTTTHTGAVACNGGVTFTNSAGSGLTCSSTGGNGFGIACTGNGSGAGIQSNGGPTGHGLQGVGGATSGNGLNFSGQADVGALISGGGGNHGLKCLGQGAGIGALIQGGATGGVGLYCLGATTGQGAVIQAGGGAAHGLQVLGGGTSGDGIHVTTTSGDALSLVATAGNGVVATANGTSKHGIVATGGTAGTSDGIKGVAGTGGVDIRGNITGNLVGTVSTLTTYTGNTPQTGDCYARLGAPAGASIAADLAEIEAETDGVAAIPTNPYTGTPPTTAQIATAVWQDLLAGADFGTAASIGALLKADIDAAISSRSTYAGGDTAGTTTLLARIGSAITITGGKVDVNDKAGFSLLATGLDLVLVAGKSLPQAVRYIGASAAGVVSGAGTATEVFQDYAGLTALTITADSSGNRTGVVYG